MAKKSKQLRAALEKIDSTKVYSVEEAVALAKETNFAKFDATVEVAYNLNIDVKKADQQIRGAMVLPNGTGKTARVLVFARGAKAEEAKAAKKPSLKSMRKAELIEFAKENNIEIDEKATNAVMIETIEAALK